MEHDAPDIASDIPEARPAEPRAAAAPPPRRNLVRLAFHRGSKKANTATQRLDAAVQVANPPLAIEISQRVLGVNAQTSGNFTTASRLTIDPSSSIAIDKRRQAGRKQRRGIFSHVRATQHSLLKFLEGADLLVYSDVMDDATLWCRLPAAKEDQLARRRRVQQHRRAGKKLSMTCGRNLAVPVMNSLQHLYVSKPGLQCWSAAQVHSPAQALPKANWSTIMSRKRKWSACAGGEMGAMLREPGGRSQEVLDAVRVLAKVATNDAAAANDCTSRVEQDELLEKRAPRRRYRLHLDVHCQGHISESLAPRHARVLSVNPISSSIRIRGPDTLKHNVLPFGLLKFCWGVGGLLPL